MAATTYWALTTSRNGPYFLPTIYFLSMIFKVWVILKPVIPITKRKDNKKSFSLPSGLYLHCAFMVEKLNCFNICAIFIWLAYIPCNLHGMCNLYADWDSISTVPTWSQSYTMHIYYKGTIEQGGPGAKQPVQGHVQGNEGMDFIFIFFCCQVQCFYILQKNANFQEKPKNQLAKGIIFFLSLCKLF